MRLIDQVLDWSEENLNPWQRDAIRRLYQKNNVLEEQDFKELYELLKISQGAPNPKNLLPIPLTSVHLPVALKKGETVILKAIRNLKNVNRILAGQELKFSPEGISLIYGGNGCGKSGYTRVMKKVCRARNQSETIHPDINDSNYDQAVPEATFEIEVNNISTDINWNTKTVSPDKLSSIAVFDSHCARTYLTTEQEIEFLPFELEVLKNLVDKVFPRLNDFLVDELARLDKNFNPFNHLINDTKVGKLISSLSANTDPKEVELLGTLSNDELNRIKFLEKCIAEDDPIAKAKDVKISAERLKNLMKNLENVLCIVDDVAVNKLKSHYDLYHKASQEEKQAAKLLRQDENLLPGTGEEIWKALFNAARKYSTEMAYPEHPFPYTEESAVCPLCQQELKEGGERLKRFEEFIQKDVAQIALKHKEALDEEKKRIENADLKSFFNEPLKKEIETIDSDLVLIIENFIKAIEIRRIWMLKDLENNPTNIIPHLGENPSQRLLALYNDRLETVKTFESLADDNNLNELKSELNEFLKRKELSQCLPLVLKQIDQMKQKNFLQTCKDDLKTKFISNKIREFAKVELLEALINALNEEFDSLNIAHIKTELKAKNEKGKTKQQITLKAGINHKIEEILSEGEQRMISLGLFLAEMKISNHKGGIILDDPVSSLDHLFRKSVAERLVALSLERQVIIFTHDVVFLYELQEECNKKNIPCHVSHIGMMDEYCGCVTEGLPWDHKGYKERIDDLEKRHGELKKLPWPHNPNDKLKKEMHVVYDAFRSTIERIVEDFILNGTVKRFNNYIKINNLKMVIGIIEESELNSIISLYNRCNNLVSGHDLSSFRNAQPPTPAELNKDIETLKSIIDQITTRRKKLKPS